MSSLEEMFVRLSSLPCEIFKPQNKNNEDLSEADKIMIAVNIYERSQIEFINIFHRFLQWPEDALNFSNDCNSTLSRYLNVDLECGTGEMGLPSREYLEKRINLQKRNRRFTAASMLVEKNEALKEYFSDENNCRGQKSKLWEKLIGNHAENSHQRRCLEGTDYYSWSGFLHHQLVNSNQTNTELEDGYIEEDDLYLASKMNEEADEDKDKHLFREILVRKLCAGKGDEKIYKEIDNLDELDENKERINDDEEKYFNEVESNDEQDNSTEKDPEIDEYVQKLIAQENCKYS